MVKVNGSLVRAFRFVGTVYSCIIFGLILPPGSSLATGSPQADKNETMHVRGFELPMSHFVSAETRAALTRERVLEARESKDPCPPIEGAARERVPEIRKCEAADFYESAFYKRLRERYPVVITPKEIGGVYTEVFTPAGGVALNNKRRVLINLHGGGFIIGSRTFSQLESIPIAAVGKIEVISIDYRQEPEYEFPAANEDVVAVYRQLLKTYNPTNIGIYGCSAGSALTAQTVAWLLKEGLPRPGAIGMFCGGAGNHKQGDSAHIAGAIEGLPEARATKYSSTYLDKTNPADPLVYPVNSSQVLAKFPPSLLITATRDHALSSAADTCERLFELGVPTELHVYEGLGHAFFYNPDLPESREVYVVITKFFDKYLGRDANAQ